MSLIVQVNTSATPPTTTGTTTPAAVSVSVPSAASAASTASVASTPPIPVARPPQPPASAVVVTSTQPPPTPSLATVAAAAAALEQQQQQQQHVVTNVPPPQVISQGRQNNAPGTSATSVTRISPAAAHIVQHHPPPLRMVPLPTSVTLPQSPAPVPNAIRHHALSPHHHQIAVSRAGHAGPHPQLPRLPRSPVKQHQLPTTPLQRSVIHHGGATAHRVGPPVSVNSHHLAAAAHAQHLRTNTVTVTNSNGEQQCIMVNQGQPASRSHLSLLPQQPAPGMIPSHATLGHHGGLTLPQNPSTLVPLPRQQQQQHSTTILPPTLLNRQMFSRTGLHPDHGDE